jgi:hypothetical protein
MSATCWRRSAPIGAALICIVKSHVRLRAALSPKLLGLRLLTSAAVALQSRSGAAPAQLVASLHLAQQLHGDRRSLAGSTEVGGKPLSVAVGRGVALIGGCRSGRRGGACGDRAGGLAGGAVRCWGAWAAGSG